MGLGGGDACFSFVWFYLSQDVRSNMSQKKDGLTIFSYMVLLEGKIIRLIQGGKKVLYVTKKLKNVCKHAVKKKPLERAISKLPKLL